MLTIRDTYTTVRMYGTTSFTRYATVNIDLSPSDARRDLQEWCVLFKCADRAIRSGASSSQCSQYRPRS